MNPPGRLALFVLLTITKTYSTIGMVQPQKRGFEFVGPAITRTGHDSLGNNMTTR